ncbi:MAG: ferrochelatase [Planctomycetota bacterium]
MRSWPAKDKGKKGILLVNLGTPASPGPLDVKRYLREFLSDPRVVDWPRWLWWPILNGIILTFRPRRSAKLYQAIWKGDSPLRLHMLALEAALRNLLGADRPVRIAMRYGEPSMAKALRELVAEGCTQLRVIPMYPQFSMSQTLSISDALEHLRREHPDLGIEVLHSYGDHTTYLEAVATSARKSLAVCEGAHLLFSFHGLPKRYVRRGDSYLDECLRTASLLAERLGHQDWSVAFQSRFGPEPWLEPDLLDSLAQLGHQGRSVVVVTPGFSCDCLETLEELDVQAKDFFLACGGRQWDRVPCLNESPDAVRLLGELSS